MVKLIYFSTLIFFLVSCQKIEKSSQYDYWLNNQSIKENKEISLSNSCKQGALNYYSNSKESIFTNYNENKKYIQENLEEIYFNTDNQFCLFLVYYTQIENWYKSFTFYKTEPYKSFEKWIYFENSNEKYWFGNDEKLLFDLNQYKKSLISTWYNLIDISK